MKRYVITDNQHYGHFLPVGTVVELRRELDPTHLDVISIHLVPSPYAKEVRKMEQTVHPDDRRPWPQVGDEVIIPKGYRVPGVGNTKSDAVVKVTEIDPGAQLDVKVLFQHWGIASSVECLGEEPVEWWISSRGTNPFVERAPTDEAEPATKHEAAQYAIRRTFDSTASRLSDSDLRGLYAGLGNGYPNPGRVTREDVDAEVAFRAQWPAKPRGRGWVAVANRTPEDSEPVLGYYPGHQHGSWLFQPGEYRVVWFSRQWTRDPDGEWSSAAEETHAPSHWCPIPGR